MLPLHLYLGGQQQRVGAGGAVHGQHVRDQRLRQRGAQRRRDGAAARLAARLALRATALAHHRHACLQVETGALRQTNAI